MRETLRRFGQLAATTLWPPRDGYRDPGLLHYLVGLLLLPLLALFLVYHWLGLLLDELLFRGYRDVAVQDPVFILGVPRSGTTALHHTLAHDPQFTTMRTWECVFGVSVTWRLCGRFIGRADRRLGRPLGRLLAATERRLSRGLQSFHPTGLDLPEEDYWTLLPVLACFGLVAAFPDARCLWRCARFDHALSTEERARLMAFYRGCIQRHLYVHGSDRRFLAKNAAFAQAAASLLQTFPDARVICCLREPTGAVASQVDALDPPLRGLHGMYRRTGVRDRMLALLAGHYQRLLDVLPDRAPGRAVFIASAALHRDRAAAVTETYRWLALEMDPAFAQMLQSIAPSTPPSGIGEARRLRALGLSTAAIGERFAETRARFDFAAGAPVPAWAIGDLRPHTPPLAPAA